MKRALATILVLIAPGLILGQGLNFTDYSYPIEHRPSSIASADFDADGDIDLAACGGVGVTVFFNDGQGFYKENLVIDSHQNPQTIRAADMDGDGDMDLVTEHFNQGRVLVFKNFGDGTFDDYETTLISSGNTNGLAVGDFDGDSDMDVATTTLGSSFFEPGFTIILFNNGDGSFADEVTHPVGNVPFGVKAANVDNDEFMDLVVWNLEYDNGLILVSNTVEILRNKGDGTFVSQSEFATGGNASVILSVADLDGDSAVDLVTANAVSGDLSIIVGNGDGTFQAPLLLPFESGVPQEIVTADIDGDSDFDIVVACSDADTLTFLTNDGNGGFELDSSAIYGDIPVGLVAADFDGDGKDDIAAGYSGSDEVVTLFVDCDNFVLGDTNGDSEFDLADIGSFIDVVTSGTYRPEADINMDGFVNLSDVEPFVDLIVGS